MNSTERYEMAAQTLGSLIESLPPIDPADKSGNEVAARQAVSALSEARDWCLVASGGPGGIQWLCEQLTQ